MSENETTKSRKRALIISSIALLAIVLLIGGATYAYFVVNKGVGATGKVNADTATTDQSYLRVGDPINIEVDPATFYDKSGNRTGETFAQAILSLNNVSGNRTVSMTYHLYLDISENGFEYSTDDEKAEILFNLTGPDGNEVTEIPGLKYVTVIDGEGHELHGFNITMKEGVIPLVVDRTMTVQKSATVEELEKIENWDAKITFVNLSTNQSINNNKIFEAKVVATKTKKTRFQISNGLCSDSLLSECIIESSKHSDTTYIYHHDGTLTNGINDNSYRATYAATYDVNPKGQTDYNTGNYFICFGYDNPTDDYDENWCPSDNIYRILGVFSSDDDYETKIIKYSNYGGRYADYYWAGSYNNDTNDWAQSTLNTETLNGNFLTSLGTWSNKISLHNWIIGGNTETNILLVPSAQVYENEIVNPASNETYYAKIGLPYVSDSAFSRTKSRWGYNPDSTIGLTGGWNITKIINEGSDENKYVVAYGRQKYYITNSLGVFPTFYLNKDIKIVSGIGSYKYPFVIN